MCLHQNYVRPTKDDASTENVLTEECKAQTDLSEDNVKNGQPLELVLDEVRILISVLCDSCRCCRTLRRGTQWIN